MRQIETVYLSLDIRLDQLVESSRACIKLAFPLRTWSKRSHARLYLRGLLHRAGCSIARMRLLRALTGWAIWARLSRADGRLFSLDTHIWQRQSLFFRKWVRSASRQRHVRSLAAASSTVHRVQAWAVSQSSRELPEFF